MPRRLDSIVYEHHDHRPSADRRGRERSYSVAWLSRIFTSPPVTAKYGLGTLLALVVGSYQMFWTEVFSITLVLWAVDMVTGIARAVADDNVNFRWSKVVDGVMRLLVICAVAIAMGVVAMAVFDLTEGTVDLRGRLSSAAYGLVIVAEFSSIMENASYFYPRLAKMKAKVITYFPGSPPMVGGEATVLVTKTPDPGEDDD